MTAKINPELSVKQLLNADAKKVFVSYKVCNIAEVNSVTCSFAVDTKLVY